jgi:hypothetical protein
MSDHFKALEKFLFRDLSFLLGGSVVIGSGLYAFQRLPEEGFSTFKYFLGLGVAYAVGYSVQEFFTLAHVVRTRARESPNTLGRLLYRLYERHPINPWMPEQYDVARDWLYENAPQMFRDAHERTQSLKQVGTTLGPCFIVSSYILLGKSAQAGMSFQSFVIDLAKCLVWPLLAVASWTPPRCMPFELTAAVGLAGLGFFLWLLGWLKVTQQGRYLIDYHESAERRCLPPGPE